MRVLAGVLFGLCLGFGLAQLPPLARAQTPDPCFYLTFTPSVQSTQTTVPLPSQTLFPTLTRPPATPTYLAPIFQTATSINATRIAKGEFTPYTPSQEFWTDTPFPVFTPSPAPQQSAGYLVVSLNGLNIRQLATTASPIVGSYSYGQTVTVMGELVTQVLNGVTYKWGFTPNGWIATQVGNTVYARKQ